MCIFIYTMLPLYTLFKVLKDFEDIDGAQMRHTYGAFYKDS